MLVDVSRYPAFARFSFAHRFRCAAAIRARDSGLTNRFLRSVGAGGAGRLIHFGGLPRRLRPPEAMRSSTIIACSICSRSALNCASILVMSIGSMIAWRNGGETQITRKVPTNMREGLAERNS